MTPLLLDEGLPEGSPSWSHFSINKLVPFLRITKLVLFLTFFYLAKFALLDQLSAIQLKLFNVNFRLSNQISIFFLWWQFLITPQKLVCLICRMIIKSLTLDIMFLPSYRWKENSDIRRSMNLQIIVNGMSFHSRLRTEKNNCKLFGFSLLKTTSRVAIFVQRRRPEANAHCVWKNHHHTSGH